MMRPVASSMISMGCPPVERTLISSTARPRWGQYQPARRRRSVPWAVRRSRRGDSVGPNHRSSSSVSLSSCAAAPRCGPRIAGLSGWRTVGSTGGQPIEIIEEATGRIIGTVDPASADRVAHPGAVYLHQGEHWLVTELDHETHEAFADAASLDFDTLPLTESEVSVRSDRDWRPFGRGAVHRGTVDVSTRVVAYLRRHLDTGRIIERVPLDDPP